MIKNFLLFGLTFFAVLGCGKDEPSLTIIKGTVTDRKTGKPIEEATVTLGFVTSTSVQGSLKEKTDFITILTDVEGQFSHTHGDYSYLDGGSSIEKAGYSANLNWGIEQGKENVLNISLLPIDAALKITILNQTGAQKSLYFLAMSALINKEGNGHKAFYYLPNNNPLTLSQGEGHTEIFRFPKDEIQIYWDFFNFYATANKAMFQDKVQLVANDTLEYNITY